MADDAGNCKSEPNSRFGLLSGMDAGQRRTLLSLGRLSEAFETSPLAAAWEARERLEAVFRLAQADGLGIDRDRILRLTHDLPVTRTAGDLGDSALMPILDLLGLSPERRSAGRGGPTPAPPELAAVEIALRSEGDPGSPVALLRNLHRWLVQGGRPSVGYVALIQCLAMGGMTPRALSVLARPSGGYRIGPTTWTEKALVILADAADQGRRDLATLERIVAEWRRRLGKRRRHSRMEALVLNLAAAPVATPTAVARRLGVSLRGAAVMLDELADLGIVVEITGRRSWKTYLVCDPGRAGAIDPRKPHSRGVTPPVRPPDMTPLLTDADAAIARAQAAVDRAHSRVRGVSDRSATAAPADEPESIQPRRRS
jgi:hypothetical protein